MRYTIAVLLLVAVVAQARIRLTCPPPVPGSDTENQRPTAANPCGEGIDFSQVTSFTPLGPGPQTVMWMETVAIEDSPFSLRLCNATNDCSYILIDHIPHRNHGQQVLGASPGSRFENRPHSLTFVMPNIQCDKCFLLLLQIGREAVNSNQDCTYGPTFTGTCAVGSNVQYAACAAITINGTNPFVSRPSTQTGFDYTVQPNWNPNDRSAGTYRQYAGIADNSGWNWPTNERTTLAYGYRYNNGGNAYRTPSGYCNRIFTPAELSFVSAYAPSITPSGQIRGGSAASLSSFVAVVVASFAALMSMLL